MKTVVIACPIATRSGYGAHSREICRAIINTNKYDVKIIPLKWGNTPMTALNSNNESDKILLDRFTSGTLNFTPDIFIQITIPTEFQRIGTYNIGITAGIESTRCKPEWVEGCNRMDVIIVPSKFTKDVFMNSVYDKKVQNSKTPIEKIYVHRPIIVIPEGIDTTLFDKNNVVRTKLSDDIDNLPEKFLFLCVGHWLDGDIGQDRKDIGMLLRTFMQSFIKKASHNKPALVLKTSMAGFSILEKSKIEDKLAAIRNIIHNMGYRSEIPNIHVLYGDLTDAEMNELYNHDKIKAMVSFHKGEGWGKPLLEFTTTGKPVISSAWSGPLDFLHPEYSFLLPGKLTKIHSSSMNEYMVADSEWYTVDYLAGGNVMRDIMDNYNNALVRSRKHRMHTINNFSLKVVEEQMTNVMADIKKLAESDVKLTIPEEKQLNLPKLKMKTSLPPSIKLPKLNKE